MNLRAVAFDIDGTLYPNGPMMLLSIPLVLRHPRLLLAVEKARKDLRILPGTESFHHQQSEKVAAELGITPDRAYGLIEGKIYTSWFKIFRRLRVFPGLIQAMNTFRSSGLKIAVMSDFPIRNRLLDLGLNGPWDAAFSSEETGYLKPHPQGFLEIAKRLNLPPEQILYVGNSYSYDVLGAAAAGMPCAHLTKKPRQNSKAVISFEKYEQLQDFVLKNILR